MLSHPSAPFAVAEQSGALPLKGWHYDVGYRVCVTGLGQKANKRDLQAVYTTAERVIGEGGYMTLSPNTQGLVETERIPCEPQSKSWYEG